MPKLLDLETHSDNRGSLVAIESPKHIPFDIKRIYYLFDNKGYQRGSHAHKNLKQIYIAIAGSCKIEFDNGNEKFEYILNNPTQGLLIDEVIWRNIKDLTPDCILLVLADDIFKEDDYIRSYEEFLNYIK
jgi:hypothetical protein